MRIILNISEKFSDAVSRILRRFFMLRLESLQSILARWQTWLFFFLQERLDVTIFLRPQKDNEVSQNKFIDSYEEVFYYIMNADICRMNAYTDVATNSTLCAGKTFVDIGTGMYLTLTKLVLKGGAAHVASLQKWNGVVHQQQIAISYHKSTMLLMIATLVQKSMS